MLKERKLTQEGYKHRSNRYKVQLNVIRYLLNMLIYL
jgi:hypothetical protein